MSFNLFKNLLCGDGEAYYYGKIIELEEADFYYRQLLTEVPWEFDKAIIFGTVNTTKRKTAWYGDQHFNYTYSKITRQALPWTTLLLALKHCVEQSCGETFNSCLMNLYPTGAEGMAWHSDGEKDLKKNGVIASFSLGAQRTFCFKHKKTKEVISLQLEPGSLLIMQGITQNNWWHRLPPTTKIHEPRINLTFPDFRINSPKKLKF